MSRRLRTTIQLDDPLLAEARKHAIEDALPEVLARRHRHPAKAGVKLTTVGGTGTPPGVDLGDGAALLDRMDRGGG